MSNFTYETNSQPAPRYMEGSVEVTPLVIEDLEARRQMGLEKYGATLKTPNGRNSLVDAYDEALDFVQYLRAALEEQAVMRSDKYKEWLEAVAFNAALTIKSSVSFEERMEAFSMLDYLFKNDPRKEA